MAKKKTKMEKAEAAKVAAQKRAAIAKAKLEAIEKLVDRGWRPKE